MIETLVVEHSVAVTVFAAMALVVTRVMRNAPLAHLVWVLVLLKFIVPSPVRFDAASLIDLSYIGSAANAPPESVPDSEDAVRRNSRASRLQDNSWIGVQMSETSLSLATVVAVVTWVSGSLAIIVFSVDRVRRFRLLLKYAGPVPSGIKDEIQVVLSAAGLSEGSAVAVTNAKVGPCLAAVGSKPVMLVPKQLLNGLTVEERQSLFAHEIAHFYRRDHWLVWLDVLVVSLFWWHPVAWLVRRARRSAAEECCDGFVIRWLPRKSKVYAGTLMKVLDFSASGSSSVPVFASGMGKYRHMKRRFEMILNGRSRHSLGRVGFLVALPLAAAAVCAPAIFAQGEGDSPVGKPAVKTQESGKCKPVPVTTVAYKVSELPVWTKDGAFAPEILAWYIQDTVDPATWRFLGGPSSLSPSNENESIVIATTAANHEAIAKMLKGFRSDPK